MGLYQSETYINDLDVLIEKAFWIKEFDQKRIIVTGSTGLIGSSLIDVLLRYNETKSGHISVYAATRNVEKAKERFAKYADDPYLILFQYEAAEKNILPEGADYIIHAASNAYPAIVQAHPIETMMGNILGLSELLEYAERHSVINTVYVSSSEIYGQKNTNKPFDENEYGFIDLLNPRSVYPMSKRAAETLCICYANEKNTPISIVRPGHIYGPTASKQDTRVSSVFAYDAAEGVDIIMKSDGAQVRSYCYMLDCASAILLVLLRGKMNEAYNISNENSIISIKEMAQYFAEFGEVGLKIELPTEKEKQVFNPMQNSSLRNNKLKCLGWEGLFDAALGISHTVKVIRESNNLTGQKK